MKKTKYPRKRSVTLKLYSLYQSWYKPFSDFYPDAKKGFISEQHPLVDTPGVLIAWGGADIHPSLYNREDFGYYGNKDTLRQDIFERETVLKFIAKKWPIIGICRGAEMGCIAAGGFLIQDISGHTGQHNMQTSNGKIITTTSLHHQMLYPWFVPHELLAWSSPSRSTYYHGITDEEISAIPKKDGFPIEPEIVWFPEIRCLAIQGHPEYMLSSSPFNKYIQELCVKYL